MPFLHSYIEWQVLMILYAQGSQGNFHNENTLDLPRIELKNDVGCFPFETHQQNFEPS